MFAPPPGPIGHRPDGKPKEVFYACGWQVRPVWPPHSTHGTPARWTAPRRCCCAARDNLTWAVLFNTRDGKPSPAEAIDSLVHKAADEVKHWPGKN